MLGLLVGTANRHSIEYFAWLLLKGISKRLSSKPSFQTRRTPKLTTSSFYSKKLVNKSLTIRKNWLAALHSMCEREKSMKSTVI